MKARTSAALVNAIKIYKESMPDETMELIASKFHVSTSTVCRILNGKLDGKSVPIKRKERLNIGYRLRARAVQALRAQHLAERRAMLIRQVEEQRVMTDRHKRELAQLHHEFLKPQQSNVEDD